MVQIDPTGVSPVVSQQLVVRSDAAHPHRVQVGIEIGPLHGATGDGRLYLSMPVELPATDGGFGLGRTILLNEPDLKALGDSLVSGRIKYAYSTRLESLDGNDMAFEPWNTREESNWLRLSPGAVATIPRELFSRLQRQHGRVRYEAAYSSHGAESKQFRAGSEIQLTVEPERLRLRAPASLEHGQIIEIRAAVSQPWSGRVQQRIVLAAAFDTVAPHIGSYDAVMFDDGRVAIQIRAGDKDVGIADDGVESIYSVDSGKSWLRKVHLPIADDFGRASIFEVRLDSIPDLSGLLLGLRVSDKIGNTTTTLPGDVRLWRARSGAENVLDRVWANSPNGNPIFSQGAIWRSIQFARSRRSNGGRQRASLADSGTTGESRHEVRRNRDLQVIGDSLLEWKAHTAVLSPLRSMVDTLAATDGGRRIVVRCCKVKR